MDQHYPRDLVGYGRNPPPADWPGGARLAVNFVLNYEEGGEHCILHGDAISEYSLSDLFGVQPMQGQRNLNMEQAYEYGSRVGVWRLLDVFRRRRVPLTIYAVGMATERHPEAAAAMAEMGCDFVSHHWRWIDYHAMDEATERTHIGRSLDVIERLTGKRPCGFYCGKPSASTRKLVVEAGLLYDSDCYNDELPYWTTAYGRPHLILPHTLDTNDGRYARGQGWAVPDDFLTCLKADFDALYREGERTPRMMTVAVHCRLAGKPGRAAAFERFVDYVTGHRDVWICRREEIARHWIARHPYRA